MKGIIFDLDGTLVDSIPGIADGVSRAGATAGYSEIPVSDVRKMVGKGAWKLCERCLEYWEEEATAENIRRMEQAFMQEYSLTWKTGTDIYPGLEELLKKLSGRGIKLGVLTNKPHDIAIDLVKYLFREVVDFSFIQGANTEFPRKPDPSGLHHIMASWDLSPDEVVYVGDSRTDGETALRAGVKCVLVNWGYEDSPGETAREFSTELVSSCEELEQALAERM